LEFEGFEDVACTEGDMDARGLGVWSEGPREGATSVADALPNLELVILGNLGLSPSTRASVSRFNSLIIRGRAQRVVKFDRGVCKVLRQWYFSSLQQVRLIVHDEKFTSQTPASL